MKFKVINNQIFINIYELYDKFMMYNLAWTSQKFQRTMTNLIDGGFVIKKGDFVAIKRTIKRPKRNNDEKYENWVVWKFIREEELQAKIDLGEDSKNIKEDEVYNS